MDNAFDQLDQIGELRALDKSRAAEQLLEHIRVHRNVLLEVRGDSQRLFERMERMLPETQALLKQANRDARAEWVPMGDAARMDARYMLADGSIRFGRSVDEVRLPDGSVERFITHGLLTDPYPVTKEQKRARDAYASFALAFTRVNNPRTNGKVWDDALLRKSWIALRKALLDLPGQVGAFCRSMFSDAALFQRVVDKTSGTGGELLLVPQIGDIRRPSDLARRIPGMVRMQEAAARSFKQPIVTGRGISKLRGSTTNDPGAFPVRNFTSSETTITVVDREITALIDTLWTADAASLMDDPMGFVMQWLESGDIDTLELAFLHGDTAASHQDTIATWTMGGYYTAGDLDGSASPLKFWIGFRARAADDSATVSAGGTWGADDHFGAIELMGNHAAGRVAAFTGLHCLYTQLLDDSNFLTVDKMGERATLVTGEIGAIGGVPIVISEFMPNDFANTGLYTGSGSTTAMVFADLDAWTYYEHIPGAGDFDVTYPERGAQYVGMVRRGVLSPTCISTEKPAALLYIL
jgi:hypothetical protein